MFSRIWTYLFKPNLGYVNITQRSGMLYQLNSRPDGFDLDSNWTWHDTRSASIDYWEDQRAKNWIEE